MEVRSTLRMDVGSMLDIVLSLAVAASFVICLSVDAVKALKRRAHWIPGDLLVLSALAIQLLNLLGTHQSDLFQKSFKEEEKVIKVDMWMIHSNRVMLCVMVAYLLPGMASRGSENFWGKLAALVIAIFLQMTSELYSLFYIDNFSSHRRYSKSMKISSLSIAPSSSLSRAAIPPSPFLSVATSPSLSPPPYDQTEPIYHSYYEDYLYLWEELGKAEYIASTVIILVSLILLILLLASAYVSSKGIEGIMSQKIPLILSRRPDADSDSDRLVEEAEVEEYSWQAAEKVVFRSWIVARAYSSEYIIARSALSSAVAFILTIQIILSMVGSIIVSLKHSTEYDSNTILNVLKVMVTILQCIFILMGWAIIGWRCCTAVCYYTTTWHSKAHRSVSKTRRSVCLVEDFWTRYIRELQQAQEHQVLVAQKLNKKITELISRQPIKIELPRIVLYLALRLQQVMVLFSKACWFLSIIMFSNKCMNMLLSKMLEKHEERVFKEYPTYKGILEGLEMLGETSESLWIANRKAIAKAKKLILQANQDGSNCEDLIHFVATKRTPQGHGMSCLDPRKPPTGLKYLFKAEPEPLEVEKHFMGANKRSWKMTAMSLITIIIHLSPICVEDRDASCSTSHEFSPCKRAKDAFKAYSEAWEIINFIEETDTEVNSIMSKAADKTFNAVKTKTEKENKTKTEKENNSGHRTPKCLVEAINELAKESKKRTEPPLGRGKEDCEKNGGSWARVGGSDSIDWIEAAAGNAIYKLCKSITCNSDTDVAEFITEVESTLADIIYACIYKVKSASVLNSRKWAENNEEGNIAGALYTAGKAKAVVEKLEQPGGRDEVEPKHFPMLKK